MVNLGAVLGEMSTGGGLTWLNSHTGIYGMHKRMYTDTEEFLGKEMCTHRTQSMPKAEEIGSQ